MTVRDLINLLTTAYDMNDRIYVDNISEDGPVQLEEVETNAYIWGFVIGKVDLL